MPRNTDDAEVALLAFALVDENNTRFINRQVDDCLSDAASELLYHLRTRAASARSVGPAFDARLMMASPECCALAERIESVTIAELVAVGTFPIVLSVFEDRARQFRQRRWAA